LADGSTIDGENAPLGGTDVGSPQRFKEQCFEEAAALRETIKGTDTFDIQTFVIGVGTSDLETTMNGIAAAGGTDHYYYAGSQEEVLQALRDILAEIVRRARAFSGGEVTSIEEEFISTEFEARMYLASFFATGGSIYEGHLRALRLVEGAIVLDSIPDSLVIWNAADNLESRDPRTRNIYGLKGGSLLEFNNSNFDSADLDVSSGADVDTVINLVRCGREALDTTVSYLGDIFHSAPIRLGSPNYFYHDDDFDKFRDTINKTRPSVIYAGSNTGLLHAFLDTSGEELFAVVPENFVSQVKALRDTHRFYVDADPMAADVWFPENSTDTFKDWDEWKTVLMAAQGEGGRGITCLDVTDPNNPSHLFSFEHDTMGLTTSVPIMYKVKRIIGAADTVERFFAFFGGGECPDSLYDMYDPTSSDSLKGNVIVALDIYEASIDSLSASDYWYIQPASGDEDKMIFPFAAAANVVNVNPKEDNLYDLLYITDLAGQLWKVDLRDPDVSTWSAKCIFQPPIPTAVNQDKPNQSPAQPSFFRPLIERDPTYGCFWVFYGTGDRSHVFKEGVSNRFYAMMDTVDSTESYPLSESDLLKVSDGGSFDPINDFPDYKGWYLEYDDYTDRDDEKTVSHATLLMDTVKFATFSPIEASDPCEPGGGEATEYIFHFRTGNGRYRSMGTGIPQAPRYSFNLEGGGFEIHQTSDVISIERKSGYGALKKVLQWKER
jgi:type IV pilus assembly protein PilY1